MSIFQPYWVLLNKDAGHSPTAGPFYLALDGVEHTEVIANAMAFDFPEQAAAYLHRHARVLQGFIVVELFRFRQRDKLPAPTVQPPHTNAAQGGVE